MMEADGGTGEGIATATCILEVHTCPCTHLQQRDDRVTLSMTRRYSLSWQASNITTPTGFLAQCYDERGNEYRVPNWVLTEPENLIVGSEVAVLRHCPTRPHPTLILSDIFPPPPPLRSLCSSVLACCCTRARLTTHSVHLAQAEAAAAVAARDAGQWKPDAPFR